MNVSVILFTADLRLHDHPPLRATVESSSGIPLSTGRALPHRTGSPSRRRWVIERTMSWLTGYRRLDHRYERNPLNYLALLGLAAANRCYKRFRHLTM